MKNILYINPSADIGGAEKSLISLVKALDKNEYTPIILLPTSGSIKKDFSDYKVIRLNRKIIEAHSILGLLFSSIFLAFYILRYKIDIIHANSKFCSRLAIWTAVLTGKKLVLHWRDFSLWPDEKTYINLFHKKIKIVAVSLAVKNFLIKNEIKVKDIRTLYDPIEPKFSTDYSNQREKYRQEFGIGSQLVMAITGRIDSWKGHLTLLKALGKLNIKDYKLLIAGNYHLVNDPELKQKLEAEITNNKLQNNVMFIGHRDDMEKVLNIVDIVIIPSDFEPLGMVALEAMAMGKTVIASNTGGLQETVIHNETGLLFTLGDANDLAEKIIQIHTDKNLIKTLSLNAKNFYLTKFKSINYEHFLSVLYKDLYKK